jgi:hypothetical protein
MLSAGGWVVRMPRTSFPLPIYLVESPSQGISRLSVFSSNYNVHLFKPLDELLKGGRDRQLEDGNSAIRVCVLDHAFNNLIAGEPQRERRG